MLQFCTPSTSEAPKLTNRCTGHCCKRIDLPYTHAEVKEMQSSGVYKLPGSKHIVTDRDTINGAPGYTEIKAVVDAMIPLEKDNIYACSHFKNGNCGIYETRPNLCGNYPYGKRCIHGKSCEWDEGIRGQHGSSKFRLTVLSEFQSRETND